MCGMPLIWFLAPLSGITALVFAWIFYHNMLKCDPGNQTMVTIAQHVRDGARAYLRQQYRIVAVFFVIIFILFALMAFGLKVQSVWVPFAFLISGFLSGTCGFLGMKSATQASSRTAHACQTSINHGLRIAFRSGAVLGLMVVGLALLDVSIWFLVLHKIIKLSLVETTVTMLCFGTGASFQALFARVGGGIFTKAADVGADLVGKVESGIPEDDPRNPAVIADNVGDNVGDVAGMGADLYESFYGALLASIALGVAAFSMSRFALNAALLPIMIAAAGALFSVLGIFVVRTGEEVSIAKLAKALSRGVHFSSAAMVIISYVLVRYLLPENMGIWGSIVMGLAAGIVIGRAAEYYTSDVYKPTRWVAEQSLTGPATVIIGGIANGMLSTGIPALAIGVGILCSYGFAGGFTDPSMGLYGVGIAAVGMLSTLGITLSTDAYGPIADNAGGNAEMSKLDPEVRKRTDALDALGNTTAATGKGFAIGSAALTALALLSAYVEAVKISMLRVGQTVMDVGHAVVQVAQASLADFMQYFQVTLLNPKLLVGMFTGSMLTFLFCAMVIKAVGSSAGKMVEEVRRQFREIPGIMEGKAHPDYASCVHISTIGAQKAMIIPSLLAMVVPVLSGLILGIAGVMGVLVGGLATGFILAVMMANSGGSWDNAKKYIEQGHYDGKGSYAHKASVVGDTVGDPFKDSAGPSLNILIKLMSMVSIVTAGLIVKFSPVVANWLHM